MHVICLVTCVFRQYTSQDTGYSSKESVNTHWFPTTKSKNIMHFISHCSQCYNPDPRMSVVPWATPLVGLRILYASITAIRVQAQTEVRNAQLWAASWRTETRTTKHEQHHVLQLTNNACPPCLFPRLARSRTARCCP